MRRLPLLLLIALPAAAGPARAQLADEALAVFLEAEDLYFAGRHADGLERIEALWAAHPAGGDEWLRARNLGDRNAGSPVAYYALRMLTDCARFRIAAPDAEALPVTLTVVLVGRAHGVEPRSQEELEESGGAAVERALDPRLLADDGRVIHQSLRLFREYVLAMTGGRLSLKVRLLPLPDLDVPLRTQSAPRRFAGLGSGAWSRIWSAIPEDVAGSTDWWWVLYPSHVPEAHADFTRTEFITGGMGVGPDGGAPCFIIDDRWLVRRPPHLGQGEYTEEERRAYLPQWLQHEFFHHLFRTWPEFGLEAQGHQWFDRSSWPDDFEGRFEPDYFQEALHKRLQTRAQPPLHVALRYAPPPPELFAGIELQQLAGEYQHTPRQNDWHTGRLGIAGAGPGRTLRWTNDAGASWSLTPDLEKGVLRIGPDNPYWEPGAARQNDFRLVLRTDADGRFLPVVEGFRFGGGLYRRKAR